MNVPTYTTVTTDQPTSPGALEITRPDWWNQAACLGADQTIFFHEHGDPTPYTQARTYCDRCPTFDQCRTTIDDLETRNGVSVVTGFFAGESPKQRRRRRIQENPPLFGEADCPRCGTPTYRSTSNGMAVMCPDCAAASTTRSARRYRAKAS